MAAVIDIATDSFEAFDPKGYLAEYYMRVDGENERLLAFHARAHEIVTADGVMLEFGGGPTLYQLISASSRAREIHFAEYSPANLREIQAWLDSDADAFDWQAFIEAVLHLEGKEANREAVAAREELMRRRITTLLPADAFAAHPLGHPADYDAVAANFVMEGITNELETWRKVFANVTNLVRPRGYFITTIVTDAAYWKSGNQVFPAVSLNDEDLCAELVEFGFKIMHLETLEADVIDPQSPDYEGYSGMAMVVAQRLK